MYSLNSLCIPYHRSGRYKRLKSEKTEKAEMTEIRRVTIWWVTHNRSPKCELKASELRSKQDFFWDFVVVVVVDLGL